MASQKLILLESERGLRDQQIDKLQPEIVTFVHTDQESSAVRTIGEIPGVGGCVHADQDMQRSDQAQVYACMRTRAASRCVVCHERSAASACRRGSFSSRLGQENGPAGEGRRWAMASSSGWWPGAPQQQGEGCMQRGRGRRLRSPERPPSWAAGGSWWSAESWQGMEPAQGARRGGAWRGGWHSYVRDVGKMHGDDAPTRPEL